MDGGREGGRRRGVGWMDGGSASRLNQRTQGCREQERAGVEKDDWGGGGDGGG